MPPVIGWQEDSIRLVVRRDDDARTIENVMRLQILLVDAQHVRRRRGISLHVVVKFEAVDVAKIAGLVHPKDDGLEKTVVWLKRLLGRDFQKIPGADCALYRLKQRVLADALVAAQNQRVIDFLFRVLHSMCEPFDDMLCVARKNSIDMIEPWVGFGAVAWND